jgi:hypothetical protein
MERRRINSANLRMGKKNMHVEPTGPMLDHVGKLASARRAAALRPAADSSVLDEAFAQLPQPRGRSCRVDPPGVVPPCDGGAKGHFSASGNSQVLRDLAAQVAALDGRCDQLTRLILERDRWTEAR